MIMENKDKPAYPVRGANGVPFSTTDGHQDHLMTEYMVGLTKREMFAMAAMQGLLANPANNSNDLMGVNGAGTEIGFIAANMAAKEAVSYADALLKQLESKLL